MHVQFARPSAEIDRPWYAWLGFLLAILTGIMAVPVGLSFLTDPTGRSPGLPQGWIEATPFGSYVIPGLYLVAVNGFGMLVLAALTARHHWSAPWLAGTLGVGMIIWIAVEIVTLPETMILTWVFLAVGFALGFIALFWLRRTGQLRLW
jgi:hypothetical protein